jgi:5-methylcytosine-specific restriction endonuclease McrA
MALAKTKKPLKRGPLVKKLDILAKEIVKLRDGNICQRCGKWCEGSNRHISHVIPVSAGNKLRWDPQNMKVLCMHDHLNWWHKNPLEAAQWFRETFPERAIYLEANRGIIKLSTNQLVEMIEEYKNKIAGLEDAI